MIIISAPYDIEIYEHRNHGYLIIIIIKGFNCIYYI